MCTVPQCSRTTPAPLRVLVVGERARRRTKDDLRPAVGAREEAPFKVIDARTHQPKEQTTMKPPSNDTLLQVARDAIELVIMRTQVQIAEHGPRQHLLNRIRDLSDAVDLIDPKTIVIDLMEYT
jgi:hypothetical protein